MTRGTRSPAEVVAAYFATVADLSSSEEDLLGLVAPDARFVEHPNPVTPAGASRDTTTMLVGFAAGKKLLSEQAFELHEVLVDGERVAVRATWRGTVGVDAGPFTRGTRLTAHIAGFLTVRDGRVLEHETFDCYEPFATSGS